MTFLVSSANGPDPVTGANASQLFRSDELDDISTARNTAACFLILLCGPSVPGFEEAAAYLGRRSETGSDRAGRFFSSLNGCIHREIRTLYKRDPVFRKSFEDLYDYLTGDPGPRAAGETLNKIWMVFFPEGVTEGRRDDRIASLREKRKVRVTSLNIEPVRDPAVEVLFTANVLLTIPRSIPRLEDLDIDEDIKEKIRKMNGEGQRFWYDHPIPVGTGLEHNELVYCMQNLSGAVKFEERLGTKAPGRNIDCAVSVSVTHPGLGPIARRWLEAELNKAGGIEGINLYMFTEDDALDLMDGILIPAIKRYMRKRDVACLRGVFGVDGEYGRHYSFLKAIARFWNVLVSHETRATFKIDLDQIFPQETLVHQTGASAFQHFSTPLWGARGLDSSGKSVYLGMLAGALVNKKDIHSSLFTPDVPAPERGPLCDEWIFWSTVPQAFSTEAEMMAGNGTVRETDGGGDCFQRVHVTGGTNGILVDALKHYRPFTPSWFGRAEDQAYLLSALYKTGGEGYLRYVHKRGLVMRHDAEAFDVEAFDQGRDGKMIGDYIRMLLFSGYARALPWPVGSIKDAVDPFTGCFISRIPVTVTCLRFALKALQLFSSDLPQQGLRFFTEGVNRLEGIVELYMTREKRFHRLYASEQRAWDLYYDILDLLEKRISAGDPYALQLVDKARNFINKIRVRI